jgi:hypothetical protein
MRWFLLPAMVVLVGALACQDSSGSGDQRTAPARGPEQLEALRKQFEAYVDTVNACTADMDCTVIFPGCPLGCFVAVPEARREEIEKKARSMLDEFGGGASVCVYNCAANGPPRCTDRRCTANPVPGPLPIPVPPDAGNDLAPDTVTATDTASENCFVLSEQACLSNPRCTRIGGLLLEDFCAGRTTAARFLGCVSGGPDGGAAVTWARDSASGKTAQFSTTQLPAGWTQVNTPACPDGGAP